MQKVNLDEAASHLPELIEAAMKGEEVIIMKDDKSLVKLVPVSPISHRPRFGSAKGLIWMSEDFDEPLEDFEPYMQ